MTVKDIRWEQRFENYSKACALLAEIQCYEPKDTIPIIREGFIQRFEVAFDLAWKTLKDYMEFLGHDVQPSPRPIIKDAFAANILKDGQVFIDMLETRNQMAHRYDEDAFNNAFVLIKQSFEPALQGLCKYLGDNIS